MLRATMPPLAVVFPVAHRRSSPNTMLKPSSCLAMTQLPRSSVADTLDGKDISDFSARLYVKDVIEAVIPAREDE